MAYRRIRLSELTIGMFVIGVDRSWLQTPFLRHKFKIHDISEIEALRRSGIEEVTIDTAEGVDLACASEAAHAAASSCHDHAASIAPIMVATDPPSVVPLPTIVLAENLALAKQRRTEWMGRLNHLFEGARATGLVSYREATQIVDEMIGVIFDRQAACYAAMSLRESDPTLYEHGLTVCTLSIIMGQALSYPREQLQQIGVAALLHDIGLIRLPRNLLKRSPTMSAAQMALHDSHPNQGIVMLEKSGVMEQGILSIVKCHHQATDASHSSAASPAISQVWSRLVGMVDLYDELLTGQSGLPPMSSCQAMTQLYQRYRGHQTLQESVAYLIRTIGVFPLYSLVSLESGELGVVAGITPGKAHVPTVYVCRDSRGCSCTPPMEVDLSQEQERDRSIHDVRDPRKEGVDIESVLRQVAK